MPFADVNGHRCYYRVEGADGRPAVILSHSLGVDHGLWDTLAARLQPYAAVVRYDTRGHGASESTAGDYSIDMLAHDVLALADSLGIRSFSWCGLSLGGMIGQWLGANAPGRLAKIVLANTTSRVSQPPAMEERRQTVLAQGMAAVESIAMSRYFSPRALAAGGPAIDWTRRTLLATDPVGYAGCCAVLRDVDQRALLARVAVPTLVISGDADVSMPWPAHGRVLSDGIPGARGLVLPAGHLSNLERPRAFDGAVLDFLTAADGDGMAVRRAVLGHAHVDRSIAAATDFTRDFQDLITRYAWGAIWTRPALERPTRRLLVLATTAAMGRWEEFRLHVRTGLAADLDAGDLKEVLLQVAVYAGVPAANTAFHIASEELAEKGGGNGPDVTTEKRENGEKH